MNEEKGKIAAFAAAIYFEQEKSKKIFQSKAEIQTSNWKNIKKGTAYRK